MPSAVRELMDILDLEPLEVNLFRGRSPQSRWQRVFGGQVIGQALVAACRSVDDVAARPPHSLHAYFLLAGDPKVPIIYEVNRIRDGKSFTTRNVVGIQHGHAIFSMSVSFHVMRPRRARTTAMIVLSVVVLPAPFRPSRATASPAPTVSDTPCSTWLRP